MIEYTHAITGCLKLFYCVFYLTMTRKKNETKLYRVKLNKSLKKPFFICIALGQLRGTCINSEPNKTLTLSYHKAKSLRDRKRTIL